MLTRSYNNSRWVAAQRNSAQGLPLLIRPWLWLALVALGVPTAVGTAFVSPRSKGRLATWPTARCLLCREWQHVLTLQFLGQIKWKTSRRPAPLPLAERYPQWSVYQASTPGHSRDIVQYSTTRATQCDIDCSHRFHAEPSVDVKNQENT